MRNTRERAAKKRLLVPASSTGSQHKKDTHLQVNDDDDLWGWVGVRGVTFIDRNTSGLSPEFQR